MDKTFNQKLIIERAIFDKLGKEHKGYHKAPMAEVVEALRQYKKSIGENKTAYNADVEKFILGLCEVSNELKDYLGKEVYLAQCFLMAEKKAKYKQEMADKGYTPCREWDGYEGQAQLIGKKEVDWFTASLNKIGKIIKDHTGEAFFIPKGKRSRGYYLRNFDEGFYKAI